MPFETKVATTSGNTEVVAAVAGYKIAIVGYQVSGSSSDTQVQLRSGTNTILTRCFTPATGVGGISCPPVSTNSEYYAVGGRGEALNVNLSGAGNVVVCVQYALLGGP